MLLSFKKNVFFLWCWISFNFIFDFLGGGGGGLSWKGWGVLIIWERDGEREYLIKELWIK